MPKQYHDIAVRQLTDFLGKQLLAHLARIHADLHGELYLTGGTIRDLLLGRIPADVDLTVLHGARKWAGRLAVLTRGAYVPLGREEDAARVVYHGRIVDFSSFRRDCCSIDDDLAKRDITINSLAVSLQRLLHENDSDLPETVVVHDPVGGLHDLAGKTIRISSSDSFKDDPLRLLRVFRFAAVLDFFIDAETFTRVGREASTLQKVAKERIGYELDRIIGSTRASSTFEAMAKCSLLWQVLPELQGGVGMEQPKSHHLDVFSHSLCTLAWMEKIQQKPGPFFPEQERILAYLGKKDYKERLCWAALLHDVGKPLTYGINEDKDGRITFYKHDQEGKHLVSQIGRRLRWSSARIQMITHLVGLHMRPFHLCNLQRENELSLRAKLRLVRAGGKHLEGLFLLAMADSLAGKGEAGPENMEKELLALLHASNKVKEENIEPVLTGPPLVTGQDLIEKLQLKPGPLFGKILSGIEQARMEKKITTVDEALTFAKEYLAQEKISSSGIV